MLPDDPSAASEPVPPGPRWLRVALGLVVTLAALGGVVAAAARGVSPSLLAPIPTVLVGPDAGGGEPPRTNVGDGGSRGVP